MKKITFLKVLAYPASAYILMNAAAQPVLAQVQEEPVSETTVEESDTQIEETLPEITEEQEPEVVELEANGEESETEEAEESEYSYNDEFAKYVEEQFLGKTEEEVIQTPVFKLFKASIAGDNLSATDHEIYNVLKPQIEAVARGDQSFTKFTVDAAKISSITLDYYTAKDLGVDSLLDENGYVKEEASDAYYDKIQLHYRRIFTSLESDMPSELYWFDKTFKSTYYPVPTYFTQGESTDENYSIKLSSLSFNFAVSRDYQDQNYDDNYHVDSKYGKSVQSSLNNAKSIVDKYAGLSDYEKLKAYVKEINELSAYNHPAIDNNQPYGDPWQIIWLFDGDPSTKVVCEGYSKGFQYLCNMSTFQSSELTVISVHGISGSGTGAGNHEWNIVHMPDGKNYVVDVTNSDSDAIGSKGELILAGTEIGNVDLGYTFMIDGDSFPLKYNQDTRNMYKDSQLVLSTFNYQETNTMRVAVKVNDNNLVEDQKINYEIVIDPGKVAAKDVFYDVTFRVPGNPDQTITKTQETFFNSVGKVGDYTVIVRAYDLNGNETSTTRKFTVAPALTVTLEGDHTNETYVNTDYILHAGVVGGDGSYEYQFEYLRNDQWTVLRTYDKSAECSIHSGTEGNFSIRVLARDGSGHQNTSNVLNVKIWDAVKPNVTVENQYYKVGQKIDLANGINVPDGTRVTYYPKITNDSTGEICKDIPNNTQNEYTVEYTLVDNLNRLLDRMSAKVYVLNGATFHLGEKNVLVNSAVDLLDGVSVTDTYGKDFGPDSGLIHVTEINEGPQTVDAKDTVSFPVKGTYTVKYTFKDSLGLNWVYRSPVVVHDPIKIDCQDVYTPVGYDIDLLEGVTGIDEAGNSVGVVVDSIVNSKGEKIENIDTSVLDTYTVTYSAVDAFGLKTTAQALFHVKKPPVISGEKTVIPVNSEIDLLEGMHAYDDKGNELKVELEYIKDADGNTVEEWYTDTPRVYSVKYITTDSDGVSTYLETELRIKALPTIQAQDIQFYQGEEFYLEDFISAKDADGNNIIPIMDAVIDKDGQLVIDWAVLDPGTYPVTIYAKDQDGIESSCTISVTVLYNDGPEITADDVELNVGDTWDPWEGVSAYDKQDGDITDKLEIISVKKRDEKPKLMKMAAVPVDIDTSQPGVFDVVYRVVDRFGKETIKEITVTVSEKAPISQDSPQQETVLTTVTAPASHGVPTGIHNGITNYVTMLAASFGAMAGFYSTKRKRK